MRLLVLLLSAPLVLLACSAAGGSEPPASSSPTPAASSGTLDPGDVPAAVFNQIVADAAAKAGVDPSAVAVLDSRSVAWSDGSLGCPQPGVMYTQVLVDGFRVILEVNGVQYDYHGTGDRFVLCPAKFAKPPVG